MLSTRLLALSEVTRLPSGLVAVGHGCRASRLAITGFTTPPLAAIAAFKSACVGTVATVGITTPSRWPSYDTNQNVLSCLNGPPSEKPNWLLWKTSCGAGLVLKKLRASSPLLRKYSYAVPCSEFVPDLVTIFTVAPELRPNSASVELMTETSCSASMGRIVAGVPNTPP